MIEWFNRINEKLTFLSEVFDDKYFIIIFPVLFILYLWLTARSWKDFDKPEKRHRVVMIVLMSIWLIGTTIDLFPSAFVIVPFILIALVSDEGFVYKAVSIVSKDFDTQMAFGKRLADWFESMSAAILVGCIFAYLTIESSSAEIGFDLTIGNKPHSRIVEMGAIAVLITIFISLRLTICVNEWASLKQRGIRFTSYPTAAKKYRPARRRPCPRTSRSRVYRRKTPL